MHIHLFSYNGEVFLEHLGNSPTCDAVGESATLVTVGVQEVILCWVMAVSKHE